MTDCPCWGYHQWIDDSRHLVNACQICDCCFWCPDCDNRRPAPYLIHQCTADPKESGL
jgi:hypothetical protein